jgi:carbamoyltransferase
MEDGNILAAICEERLSRIKQDKSFPHRSINYCLESSNLTHSCITDVFVGWNPAYYLYNSTNDMYNAFRERGKLSYFALNEMSVNINDDIKNVKIELNSASNKWKIHFVSHHHAHLAYSYFLSGYKNPDFLVLDGFGETTTGFIGSVRGKDIDIINYFNFPHSMGAFYGAFTQLIGFKRNSDEWKAMALAAFGDSNVFYDFLDKLIDVKGTEFELDLSYFEFYLYFTKYFYSDKLLRHFGGAERFNRDIGDLEHNIMAAVQRKVETVVFELLNNLNEKTKNNKVVLSGGFFMNSVLNGKITSETNYDEVFIGGSPDDSGVSIGAAMYGNHYVLNGGLGKIDRKTNYFGRQYKNAVIEETLQRVKLKYEKIDCIEKYTAEGISKGLIVGWFQGESEFGQRALGNRSILADPTNKGIKDLVNESVKFREGFRPFAPAIKLEDVDKYFSIDEKNENFECYFMEKVLYFREEYREKLPGVVHADGSGRLQTVSMQTNPLFYRLINEFEKLSGIGCILNTSLNINGMPLVESPEDAIECFFKSGIDLLVLGNYVIIK